MLDRFTKEQLYIVQKMLFENAEKENIPVSPVGVLPCEPCVCNCLINEDTGEPDNCKWRAASLCEWCNGIMQCDMDGKFHCDDEECTKVVEFYGGIKETIYGKYSQDKKYRDRRNEARSFFHPGRGGHFYRLTYDEKKLGMLLGFKKDIKETVKKLREVVNGPN